MTVHKYENVKIISYKNAILNFKYQVYTIIRLINKRTINKMPDTKILSFSKKHYMDYKKRVRKWF